MLELGTFGSVRGVPGDGYPYRNPRPLPVIRQRLLLTWSADAGNRPRRRSIERRDGFARARPAVRRMDNRDRQDVSTER